MHPSTVYSLAGSTTCSTRELNEFFEFRRKTVKSIDSGDGAAEWKKKDGIMYTGAGMFRVSRVREPEKLAERRGGGSFLDIYWTCMRGNRSCFLAMNGFRMGWWERQSREIRADLGWIRNFFAPPTVFFGNWKFVEIISFTMATGSSTGVIGLAKLLIFSESYFLK